jgi:phosphatidate cytidylyltransferase
LAEENPKPVLGAVESGASELAMRTAASVVLIPIALFIAYLGGWGFAAFWGVAAVGVLWEWTSLVGGAERRRVLFLGGFAIAVATVLTAAAWPATALAVVAVGAAAAAIAATQSNRLWMAAAVIYASAVAVPAVLLRLDPEYGFIALVFVFAIVWSTDVLAYIVGRTVGGPKLLPRLSPKKTWSGGIGGLIAAILAGILVAKYVGLSAIIPIAMVAAMLSIAAQSGDFLESAVKRRFGAKDASHIIPGHGGLMDRLDGFLAAATLAAAIGVARGGVGSMASGLLIW